MGGRGDCVVAGGYMSEAMGLPEGTSLLGLGCALVGSKLEPSPSKRKCVWPFVVGSDDNLSAWVSLWHSHS